MPQMLDVERWLADHGLAHYTNTFAQNGIAADVLHDLTDADLKELGLNLGDRKRLLKAIAVSAAGPTEARLATNEQALAVSREAERRHLTVMFVDLVASTELAARLDPEDTAQVIRAYHGCCARVIGLWGGHVAKYMGDGVLAYFGWPAAHEDEAERAVRAGLAIVDGLAHLETPAGAPLAVRIGIATGLVMVGELTGAGEAQERTVVGETPNLAARLETLAAPDSIVISQATRRLVGATFELADLGPQCLKGFVEPLVAWRVVREGRAEGRFEARQSAGLTPLVGREEDLALLLRRWRQARDGEGQVVLLSGEPGIGKSRLVRELHQRVKHEPHIRVLYQCSPHHTTSPLHPAIEQLKRAVGLEREEPTWVKLEKLSAHLASATTRLDAAVALIGALLGILPDEGYELPELTPQRQKRRTLEVLIDHLEGLAAEQPVIVAYEDVHWVDPTTQELLEILTTRVQRLALLLLITFRPEFKPPWASQPHISTLALTRLGRRDGAAMLERVAGAKTLPGEVATQIVAKTDGVPLFLEELTKAVLETWLLKNTDEGFEFVGPLQPLTIPATLYDSLLARLDRLPAAKEIAQIGAAIGREFSHDLLAAVTERPATEWQPALDQLVSSELVFRHGAPTAATYSFKHALVQDTAYGTLLRSRRQQLHGRIAQALEAAFPDTVENQPEVVAQHYAQAGNPIKAVEYFDAAGHKALGRCAATEAAIHLTRALDMLAGLNAGAEHRRKELELQLSLAGALTMSRGWASPEMGKAYARARDLCQEEAEHLQRFSVLDGTWVYHHNRAELEAAYQVGQEMLGIASTRNDAEGRRFANRAVGISLLFLGRHSAALEHLEQAAVARQFEHRVPPYGRSDPWITCRSFLAWTLLLQGYADRARSLRLETLAAASELDHPYTSALIWHVNCLLDQVCGDRSSAEQRSTALMTLATEHMFPHFLATGTFFHGWALAANGNFEAGIDSMRLGLAAKKATGAEIKVPYYLGLLASALAEAGRSGEALPLLAEAISCLEQSGERWFEAELYRRKGEVLLSSLRQDQSAAEACFRHAIAVAQTQGARLWQLRSAVCLARLWRDQRRNAEARRLLAPVYDWFTEGLATADVKDAKALLDDLA